MYLGIDLGTSGIKVIIIDSMGKLRASETANLEVSRPKALWSEQDPADWWSALALCMQKLQSTHLMSSIKAIGLSGQMHGATLLDSDNAVIRPAILWNDGRCQSQCKELEYEVKNSRDITGNIVMPGFTAPKIKWVQQNEPDVFKRINKVMLPKDYLRFLLSGDFASDMSDAAGTMWLDVEKRAWNNAMLSACGLNQQHMPTLFEGNQITGYLHQALAQKWNMSSVPIVAGGGDNAAGAIGVGLIEPGQGMISLGTSGVYFVVTDKFTANPQSAVHSFCHALPNRWHLMSVMLSAASCLQWFAENVVEQDLVSILEELEKSDIDTANAPIFLPYLSGERTPHNNPNATGMFFGLKHQTNKLLMLHAVLEGICFAFADGIDAVHQSGTVATEITLIGGGSKSLYWRQMFADVLGIEINYREGGDVGPALGAARLAQLAIDPKTPIRDICPQPRVVKTYRPNQQLQKAYATRRSTFIKLYPSVNALYNG